MIKLIDLLEKYHDFANILEDYSKQDLSIDEKWELFVFKSVYELNTKFIYYVSLDDNFVVELTLFLNDYFNDNSIEYLVDYVEELSRELKKNNLMDYSDFALILSNHKIMYEDVLQKYKEEIIKLNYVGLIYD